MRSPLITSTLAALLTACAVAQSPLPDAGDPDPPRDMLPPLDRDPRPDPDPDSGAPDPEPDAAPDPEPDSGPDPDMAPPPDPDMGPPPDPDMGPPPDPDMGPPPDPDMGPPPEDPYTWLIIVDDTQVDSNAGTAGIDLCGVAADCDGVVEPAVQADYIQGDGLVCGPADPDPCSGTARDDPSAALDIGAACEAGSSPSDYVSLGLSGQIGLRFERPLPGCTVTVFEFAGRDDEPYDAYVCRGPILSAEDCLLDGEPVLRARLGGDASADIPQP